MVKALLLTMIEFDSMENRIEGARCPTCLGVFLEPGAKEKISDYIDKLPDCRRYEGWDNQMYPQFVIAEVDVF